MRVTSPTFRPFRGLETLRDRAAAILKRADAGSPGGPDDDHRRAGAARRWKLLRNTFAWAGVGVVSLTAAVVITALGMTGRAPTWWRSIDPSSPATVRAGAELESSVIEQASRIRPTAPGFAAKPSGSWQSDEWALRISAAEANAWLNSRLAKWVANGRDGVGLPAEIKQIQVEFDEGEIQVGAKVQQADREQFLSATIQPGLATDGALWTRATWLYAGRFPVPASWVLGEITKAGSGYLPEELRVLPETSTMLRAFSGEVPVLQSPVLGLGDGRRVRLLRIRAEKGVLEVTCRTEKK